MSAEGWPRVDSLTYSHDLVTDSRKFVEGFRQVVHLGDFHCEIDSEKLVARPNTPFKKVEEAQGALEPHLRAWELRSELLLNSPVSFKKAGHVVRDEQDGQRVGIGVAETISIAESTRAVVTTARIDVPSGPPLEASEEVERLRRRWREVVTGGERLLVGAYWILTEVERYFGGRKAAAKQLTVSKASSRSNWETLRSERSPP